MRTTVSMAEVGARESLQGDTHRLWREVAVDRVADKHHITDSGVLPQRDKARPCVGVQKGTHLGLDRGQLSLQPHHQHRVLVLQLPDAALVAAQEACRLLTLRIGLLQLQHTQQVC